MMEDAILRRYSLLALIEARIPGFQFLKELYKRDAHFSSFLKDRRNGSKGPYIVQYGFLFKGNQLRILNGPNPQVQRGSWWWFSWPISHQQNY